MLLPLNTHSFAQQTSNSEISAVAFTAPDAESALKNTTGHVDLVWEPSVDSKELSFQLVSAPTEDFVEPLTHYKGADHRSFISGLEARTYFFKVRALGPNDQFGPWSETIQVDVNYVNRARVNFFMLLGTICLLGTIVIIVGGSLRTKNSYQSQS